MPDDAMANYDCDTREMKKALLRLEGLVKAAGGFIDDSITVRAKKGEISLHSSAAPANNQTLVSLPEAALPFFDEAGIELQDDEFQLPAAPKGWAKQKTDILKAMLEILNLAGKARIHKDTSPWMLAASKPALFEKLLAGRPLLAEMGVYKDFKAGKGAGKLATDSFFMARTLVFDAHKALLPFIEYANHHLNAAPFRFDAPGHPDHVVAIGHSQPVAGSDECFVQYSILDAYDLLMTYGFFAGTQPFVRSVPLTITLEGLGTITVNARIGILVEGQLHESVRDLKMFLPKIEKNEGGELVLTHLNVPDTNSPHAMKRVLVMMFRMLDQSLPQDALMKYLRDAEQQICEANISFYRDLQGALKGGTGTAIKMASDMAAGQLTILEGYGLG